MSKRFFVIISYSAVTKGNSAAQLSGLFHRRPSGPLMDQDQFQRFRSEAFNRAGIIAGGLERLGIKCRPLDTQELIELFYTIYNPDVATEERLTDIDILNAGVVHAPEAMPAGVEGEEALMKVAEMMSAGESQQENLSAPLPAAPAAEITPEPATTPDTTPTPEAQS